jgi:hypothetical protein
MALARVSSCRRAVAAARASGGIGGCLLLAAAVGFQGGDDLAEVAFYLPVHFRDAGVAGGLGGGDDLQGRPPLRMVLREELGSSHEKRASQTRFSELTV